MWISATNQNITKTLLYFMFTQDTIELYIIQKKWGILLYIIHCNHIDQTNALYTSLINVVNLTIG